MTVASFEHRLRRLEAAGAIGGEAERLLRNDVILWDTPNETHNEGSDATWLVLLAAAGEAIFKRIGPNAASSAAVYQHDPAEANIHEAVAWRLALAMGPPFDTLVPIATIRTLPSLGRGVLIERRRGEPQGDHRRDVPDQYDAAAFWDAVIGNQDRHGRNFRYDAAQKRLSLIDHAFAFARPGDYWNRTHFLGLRLHRREGTLWDAELEALERLLATDLHGVDAYLAKDRADALTARIQHMLATGRLPDRGDF